jgi:hypothetical protein
MIMNITRKFLAGLLITCLLMVTACADTPSPYDQVQEETTQSKETRQEVSKEAKAGSNFNKFFPEDGDGYERVFTSEKSGYAEAILKEDGKEVATVAISDSISDPSIKDKFNGSGEDLDGYPVATQGKTKTSILVGDRYQVTVTSKDLAHSDRLDILSDFDLSGLENLQ